MSSCTSVMWILTKLSGEKERISPVGVSAVGTVSHNFGQIIASSLILGTINVVVYLPVLIVSSVITGALVGFSVKRTLPYVKKYLMR